MSRRRAPESVAICMVKMQPTAGEGGVQKSERTEDMMGGSADALTMQAHCATPSSGNGEVIAGGRNICAGNFLREKTWHFAIDGQICNPKSNQGGKSWVINTTALRVQPTSMFTARKISKKAVQTYENIINEQARQGWEYVGIDEFQTTLQAGCLRFWASPTVRTSKMLVFRKEA